MDRKPELLRKARLGPSLSPREMADLVGLEVEHVEALESGAMKPSTDLLDRYARVFGLSLRRFLAGFAESAPATVLFRSLHDGGPSFADLVETGASSVLGEFLRCASDVAELAALLDGGGDRIARELGALPAEAAQDVPGLFRQAERLALDVRTRLGLGLDPVPSMIELVEDRLRITLVWIGPDDLDRDIDAASVRGPSPATLVNLVGGAECWWRTRMTLAHELCHQLFDLDPVGAPTHRAFLFSPHRGGAGDSTARPRIRLPDELELVERRANVFAAHFLAPPSGVRSAVGGLSPTSDDAINVVCQRFQIGRMTAVNQITNIYRLSKEERLGMLARRPSELLPRAHRDAAVHPGLRAGRLPDLVARAVAEGRIDKVRARQYLTLSLSDPLPAVAPLTEAQRAPLHLPEHVARLSAHRYLIGRPEFAGCSPARVVREGDHFRVDVEYADEACGASPLPRGYLIISSSFAVLEQESHVELNAAARA